MISINRAVWLAVVGHQRRSRSVANQTDRRGFMNSIPLGAVTDEEVMKYMRVFITNYERQYNLTNLVPVVFLSLHSVMDDFNDLLDTLDK